MGLWSASVTSFNASGTHSGMLPYHPRGPSAHFSTPPREGLLHNMKRGMLEMTGLDNSGAGMISASGRNVRYGGGLLSGGGWREVLHEVQPITGNKMFAQGARRTLKGSLGKFAGKAIFPAMFAYQAATEGIGVATRDAAISGAVFGAARWGLTRLGMGILNPFTLGAAAITGAVIGGRQALIAGREYGTSMSHASFGSQFNDINGTAATMRQASLSAIQNSRINGRNSLGMEASLLHQR